MSVPTVPNVPITIAILTFKRPYTLLSALTAVADQAASLPAAIDILVVDNDSQHSAEEVVMSVEAGVPVHYLCEPTPGIAAARNAALRMASKARLLIFFDDDQTPEVGWLANLVEHWERARCVAVAGPVLSQLPDPVPSPWVVASGVFDRTRYVTGTHKSGAGAGNLLLDMDFLRHHGLKFDAKLGLQGGEDTLLTHEIVAVGGVIEWCDEAVATEQVPPERVTHGWMRRRSFRAGTSWSRAELRTANSTSRRARKASAIILRSTIRIVISTVLAGTGFLRRSDTISARNMRTVYSHIGAIAGLIGGQVNDYSRN